MYIHYKLIILQLSVPFVFDSAARLRVRGAEGHPPTPIGRPTGFDSMLAMKHCLVKSVLRLAN